MGFQGIFEVSPLFYGWYTNNDNDKKKYRLPLAYFITGLMVYAYSFFATLRKMAENSKMSKLCEKDDECIFSWKLFTAWDHMIGSSEAAHNRVASILMGFKEALLEEAEKKKEVRNWKITGARILVNIIILGLFFLSAGSVVFLVHRSVMPDGQTTFWRRNELTIVMTLISIVFPMLFDAMGFFEQYHPRKQLRIQLARIMALNLLNLYSLIFSQFDKIHDISDEMTNYLMELSSQRNLGRMKKNLFEKFPDISPGKTIYCYQTCHWNVTPSSLLVGALVLNSSISAPSSVINDITTNSSSKTNWSISMNNQSIDQNDYPSYDDYFTLDVKNHSESNTNSSLKSSPLNERGIFSTASYDTEATWRDKSPDYLSFILSEFDSMENNTQSSFLNLEYMSEVSAPDIISKESITTIFEYDSALEENSTIVPEYFYEYASNDSSLSTSDSGVSFTNIVVGIAEPDSFFEEIINKSFVPDYEFENNSSTISAYDYTFQENGTTTSEFASSSTPILDIIIEKTVVIRLNLALFSKTTKIQYLILRLMKTVLLQQP
ncbi:hypothetical protein WA026_016480 [Henosepilachna vigintioctopunctata]|uniref:Uncharacterized protein n=1 Tax=Henosepilachna vigintioctopunctata TaxID=420089 RepID=A0AAW1UQ48_9CUCU